jgi:hypothetical protein
MSEHKTPCCISEDEDICLLCSIGDELEDPDSCEFDNKRDGNYCPKFICCEQCRLCPTECEYLDK